jgi:hypothetical protein
MQKTIVAGMAPQIQGGQFVNQGQQPPQQMQQMQQPSGPQKTILLQPTDGIVSVAAAGGPVSAQAQPGGGAMAVAGQPQGAQGASTLFWIISLMIGIGVGALAYVIVLQM